MSKDIVFKLSVLEGGEEKYSTNLPYDDVSYLVSSLPEDAVSDVFLSLAAKHPSSLVREFVAHRDSLSPEVFELLAADKSISVLRNLARTNAFLKNASQDFLEKMICLDVEIAQSIAEGVELFEQVDVNMLAPLLAVHEDPSVAAKLAGNENTPKNVLRTLVDHADPFVASEAKATLGR